MNERQYPVEADLAGRCVRIRRSCSAHNPTQTADGRICWRRSCKDDTTRNVVVPEKYRETEGDIQQAWLEHFCFEKITAENGCNHMTGIDQNRATAQIDLAVDVIYAKDGQEYFMFSEEYSADTGNRIRDPVGEIKRTIYPHGFLSQ